MSIFFTKMHGLGNDFVLIDKAKLPIIDDLGAFVRKISDRHLGVGCDQFILYELIKDDNVPAVSAHMFIYNQDGSEAKACGNASRCLTRLIFDKTQQRNINLIVADRVVSCTYTNPEKITINMGEVSFNEDWMPSVDFVLNSDFNRMIDNKDLICVDVGNPHAVILSPLSEQEQIIIGQKLQNPSLFKEGVNVNFVTLEQGNIYLRVWERGAGFTYACGSGAVASFTVCRKLGLCGDSAKISFPLGVIDMSVDSEGKIIMSGPGTYIFSGDYYYE